MYAAVFGGLFNSDNDLVRTFELFEASQNHAYGEYIVSI